MFHFLLWPLGLLDAATGTVFCDLSEAKPVYNSTAFGMMLRKQHSVAIRFIEEYYEKSSYPPYEVPDFVRMHQLRWTAASIVSKIFDPMRTAAAKGDEPSIDVSELLGDLTKNGLPPDEVAASLNALSTTTESEKLSEVVTETEDRSLSEARVTTSSQEADILYVSPAVTNCQSMGGVLRGVASAAGGKKPKVILATVNPLIPPPVDIRPQPPSIQPGDELRDSASRNSRLELTRFQKRRTPRSLLNAQCSVSGQDSVMASRGYTYDGFMHQSCILGLDSYASLSSGGSEVAPINAAFCEYLSSRGVAVELGCEGTDQHGTAVDNDKGLPDREAQSGHLLRGKRGWGNDRHTQSSAVDSVQECASYCASLKGCQFWTFDDTAMYGAQMCWAWTEGYPDEVRDEGNGWASMNWTDFTASAHSGREKAHLLDSPDPSPWAYFPMREMIGQRYALTSSGRGRCVDTSGECECFPPYRGLYCSVVDRGLGLDQERPYRGVLHYLTSNLTSDVSDLNHSLPILWYRWNRRYDYPIVVFHDGLSADQMELLTKASSNRVWFAYVEGYLDLPKWITEDTKYKAMLPEVKWSLGYRGMCKFRSGPIFGQPVFGRRKTETSSSAVQVLKAFDYMMTLDTDGYLPDDLAYDPIQQMYEGDYVYSYSHTLNDQPAAVQHFWDHTLEYMAQRGIEPLGTELLREFIDQVSLEWTYRLFMNDIEVVHLGWFRSAQYMDYYNYLDSQGGWWLYRWGDHAVRTMAVAMWLDKKQLMHMDIPYGHQSFCRCASPERICVRNSDMGLDPRDWFTCVSFD
ncbi:alpha 1,2-mannosyltransferase 2.4.1 [Perkinsus olseni]|uniref:Alpha 1,2-mannosyltransferase 2.4.1 n=1 Tax=Perkinsus olseni TaxID=32597 RepID=A0A7J6P3N3_PEROL|nr:alpha 1,2-mannosyltransferase 2.4.1 [Perkinsus olseni]